MTETTPYFAQSVRSDTRKRPVSAPFKTASSYAFVTTIYTSIYPPSVSSRAADAPTGSRRRQAAAGRLNRNFNTHPKKTAQIIALLRGASG